MSEPTKAITPDPRKPSASERFAANISKQFESEVGQPLEFSEYERTLAQHMFIKIDASLKEFEAKRIDKGQPFEPFTWENVNMIKLALDVVNRVRLGLDALIPSHVYPICYWNKHLKKYDVDLRIGYRGVLYYKINSAVYPPSGIRLELVYSTDTFVVFKKDMRNMVEGYEFKINNPFDRGSLIGAFGYIEYLDTTRNELVLVSGKEIEKARNVSQGKDGDFWTKWTDEMSFKTLVHRVAKKLYTDPRKVNSAALASVEDDEERDRPDASPAQLEADQGQNKTPLQLDDEEAYVQAERPALDAPPSQLDLGSHPQQPDELDLPLSREAQPPQSQADKPRSRRP